MGQVCERLGSIVDCAHRSYGATVALLGYWATRVGTRIDEKSKSYARALNALEKIKSL